MNCECTGDRRPQFIFSTRWFASSLLLQRDYDKKMRRGGGCGVRADDNRIDRADDRKMKMKEGTQKEKKEGI